MTTRWRHALLLGLATVALATGETRMVNGATTGTILVQRGAARVSKPVRVAVDEKANVYLVVQDGFGRTVQTPFPGKDLPKVVQTLQQAIRLFRTPQVRSGNSELGSFLHTAGEEAPKPAEAKPAEPKIVTNPHGRMAIELPAGAGFPGPGPFGTGKSLELRVPQGIKIVFRAGHSADGTAIRMVLVTLHAAPGSGQAEVAMTEAETTALASLLQAAPPTYQALLAARRK